MAVPVAKTGTKRAYANNVQVIEGKILKVLLNQVVAITVWQGRVSPVFDVAEELLLFKTLDDGSVERTRISSGEGSVYQKLDLLISHKVNILICGAISRFAEELILEQSIGIHSFKSGDVEELITAITSGSIDDEKFSMPGCMCGRRERFGRSSAGRPEGRRNNNRCRGEQNFKHRRGNGRGMQQKSMDAVDSWKEA